MKYRLALVGLGTSALTVLAACGNGPPPDGNSTSAGGGAAGVALVDSGTAATKVQQNDNLQFAPTKVTAKVGDVVEFDNGGSVAHNVTFDAGAATNGNMSGGDKALFKFTVAGTFKYQCTLHAGMNGEVDVA